MEKKIDFFLILDREVQTILHHKLIMFLRFPQVFSLKMLRSFWVVSMS